LGMGLAICRSVVENHRGRLSFESNPGGGTVFHILLPLAPQ
jgi:two-component system sensor histidine kinase DctS